MLTSSPNVEVQGGGIDKESLIGSSSSDKFQAMDNIQSSKSIIAKKPQIRKQGVSCDACKFRKVRCDRRTKLENKPFDQDENDVACSVCSQHGIRCTYTPTGPRRRRGKRIVAIQKSQFEGGSDSNSKDHAGYEDEIIQATESKASPTIKTEPSLEFDIPIFDQERKLDPIELAKNSVKPSNEASNAIHTGLFGVRGLNRALVDSCVQHYFKYAAACQPILRHEIFSARYLMFFTLFEKNNGQLPLSMEKTDNLYTTPLSILLILSVACVGASFLEPPICEPGSSAKFRLQNRLALRFQELYQEKELITHLKDEGSDIVEACYIIADAKLKVLGNEQTGMESDWNSIIQAPADSRSSLDPLRTNPSTSEAVIRMIFSMGMNKKPKRREDCPPDDQRKLISGGVFITEIENYRRTRTFWSVFIQDAFTSFRARRNVKIGDDDYDLDLPRFIEMKDGQYTSTPWLEAKIHETLPSDASHALKEPHMTLTPVHFGRADALQYEMLLRLAFVIRTVTIRFVSPRAQGRGVLITDVEKATASLDAWWKQRPAEVKWETQAEPLLRSLNEGLSGSNNALAIRSSIKMLFLELLYHVNVLGVWSSVEDYDIRFEVDLAEAIHLFASRMGLNESNNLSVKDSIEKMLDLGENVEERKEKARSQMESLVSRSFQRVAKVAKEAGLIGVLRANRNVMLNVCIAYSAWGCKLAKKIAQTGDLFGLEVPLGRGATEYAFSLVDDILFAMSTIDSYEMASETVKRMTGLLRKSRAEAKSLTGMDSFKSRKPIREQGEGDMHYFHYFYKESEISETETPSSSNPTFAADSSTPIPTSSNFTSPSNNSQMDGDEIMQLAQAALPISASVNRTLPKSENIFSHRILDITSKKENIGSSSNSVMAQAPSQLYGPSLDLDLASITGMDTSWIQNYSQNVQNPNQNTGYDHTFFSHEQNQDPASSNSNFQPSTFIPAQQIYPNQQAHIQPTANSQFLPSFQQPSVTSGPGYDGSTSAAQYFAGERPSRIAFSVNENENAAALSGNWDQIMFNGADAQVWAESQWQGFNFPPSSNPM